RRRHAFPREKNPIVFPRIPSIVLLIKPSFIAVQPSNSYTLSLLHSYTSSLPHPNRRLPQARSLCLGLGFLFSVAQSLLTVLLGSSALLTCKTAPSPRPVIPTGAARFFSSAPHSGASGRAVEGS